MTCYTLGAANTPVEKAGANIRATAEQGYPGSNQLEHQQHSIRGT